MHAATLRRDEVDVVADPLRIRAHATHPDVAVQRVREIPIHRVEALRRAALRVDDPEVFVRGESARKVVPAKDEAPVVGGPGDACDLHRVVRQLGRFPGGHLDDEHVLEVGPQILRLRDVRDALPVVRPRSLRDVDLTFRHLLHRFRREVQEEDVLAEIVDEALVVEPEVDAANRADVLIVLAHVRQEEHTLAVRRPCGTFDPLLTAEHELRRPGSPSST